MRIGLLIPSMVYVFCVSFAGMVQIADAGEESLREVAVTLDDLPLVGGPDDIETVRRVSTGLLAALKAHRAPATGFVTESTLNVPGEIGARISVLETWLDAGVTLGNHTYSHLSLNDTPLERYEEDVLAGEAVTRRLMESRGLTLRYFRHPFTRTGATAEDKAAFESFLREHGYRVAPFTVENSDYVFNAVYVKALDRRDQVLADRVREAYLDFQDTMFGFFEELSRNLLGREIRQILLIHANLLQAHCLDDLLSRLESRGYRFITLDRALEDDAYRLPDEFIGPMGPSWLHRWTLAKGIPMQTVDGRRFPATLLDEPDPPSFILELYQSLE